MNEIVLGFIVGISSTFAGVSIYEWLKAERDERVYRRIMEDEARQGTNPPMYRLVMDERSDRG